MAVYGRAGGLQIYELLGMAREFTDDGGWVAHYESGLAAYRARDFAAAIPEFEKVITLRSQDQASSVMIERCKRQLEAPAGDDLGRYRGRADEISTKALRKDCLQIRHRLRNFSAAAAGIAR
ncbi:MAG: hypothetical protein WDN50_16995 [Bradyrhizobium sp.]